MQPPPSFPGDQRDERRRGRLGAVGILILIGGLVVVAVIAVTGWVLLSPKLLHRGDDGPKASGPLQFRPVVSVREGPCTSGGPYVTGAGGTPCYRLRPGMTVTKVADAHAESSGSDWLVVVRLNAQDAKRFTKLTAENANRRVAVVANRQVITAPVVQGPIPGGQVQISGNFTGEAAKDLARSLRG